MKYNLKPFSENIIFIDTEFTGNDLKTGGLLSIGMIKMDGEELYLEIKHKGKVSSWVKQNIIPTLGKSKVSQKDAIKRVKRFCGKGKPYLVTYVSAYDTVYLHKLFGFEKFEDTDIYTWPIDFASMLFAWGKDPDGLKSKGLEETAKSPGIDVKKYHIHNALDDAKLLREVYLKMVK